MNTILWSSEHRQWFDYDLSTNSHSGVVAASNFFPLWAGCWDHERVEMAVESLVQSGLVLEGGVSATVLHSGEQWDYPNAWPPIQEILVEGLQLSAEFLKSTESTESSTKAKSLAEQIAVSCLKSYWNGYQKYGVMFERYDSRTSDGSRGDGGEYSTQTGFGWTNGTALKFLSKYSLPFLSFF
eukprot:CAMPEP_0182447158 /NCGR_PEP_ID=MMETSP1172-20130603/12218_1 /TAXON_ID=708627 /ORGANISM="Timspurckia oligopyrenoides, Strain CCMP3278" /LENGTH=182 /DNA_ID=CAMNT_0024643491 /DNA_START=189 /DNA_END=734 /DNA_ORIENTATION=+